MIIGEIRRYLRDNSAVRVSRSMRDTAYRAMQIKEQLTAKNNREPTVEEIAKLMDVPKENVVLALEAVVEPVSLYEPVFSDGNDTVYVMDQIGDNSDDSSWLEELAMKEAIARLSDREKRILTLRFFRGKTQMETAAEIGISQAQVSRIEKGALDSIKKSYAVGAFLAQRQPFCHFVTFPLIGESPMCPPELRFLSNHIRHGNVGLPVPGAHAGAPLRLCQMLS